MVVLHKSPFFPIWPILVLSQWHPPTTTSITRLLNLGLPENRKPRHKELELKTGEKLYSCSRAQEYAR